MGRSSWRPVWIGLAFGSLGCAASPPAPRSTPPVRRDVELVELCASTVVEHDRERCLAKVTPAQQRGRAETIRLLFRGAQLVRRDVVSGSGAPLPREPSRVYDYAGQRLAGWSLENPNGVVLGRDVLSRDELWVRWLDEQDRPRVRAGTRVGGARRQLDAHGRVTALGWVNARREPAPLGDVYEARVTYDALGAVESRSSFGAQGEPVTDEHGAHRVVFVNDARGLEVERRYFDGAGRAARVHGAHLVRTTRDSFGNAVRTSYFDAAGRAAPSETDGAVTVRYGRDERGNEVLRERLDEQGRPSTGPDGWASRKQTYDERDAVLETSYFDVEGEPVLDARVGAATVRRVRDERGNVVREQLLDASGAPVQGPGGYDTVEVDYDLRDNPTSFRYSAASGAPVTPALRRRYYDGDRLLREEYLDAGGRLTLSTAGYAAYDQAYEEDGSEGVRRTYDAEGSQRVTCRGTASAALQSELAERAGSLRACYERLLRYGSAAEGRLMLEVSIDGRGQVLSAAVAEDDIGDGDLTRCALATMSVAFLSRADGDCATVRVPVTFRQQR